MSYARMASSAALVAALAAGCGAPTTPYRFRAPMVASVRAQSVPRPVEAAPHANAPDHRSRTMAAAASTTASTQAPVVAPSPPDQPSAGEPGRGRHAVSGRSAASGSAGTEREQQARPATQRTTRGTGEPAPMSAGIADRLRALVGQRDDTHDQVGFALYALACVGASLADEVRAAAAESLLAVARERGALAPGGVPLSGDLVVFGPAESESEPEPDGRGREAAGGVGGQPMLVGVAVDTYRRDDGHSDGHLDAPGFTVEFVYLAGGVIRRGFATPSAPRDERDRRGRPLNTFLRHGQMPTPAGTRFLAGALWAGAVRLERLAP